MKQQHPKLYQQEHSQQIKGSNFSPWYSLDSNLLEGLKLCHAKRLKELGFSSLERRSFQEKLMAVLPYLQRSY